ncbi:hypothetical protein LTR56_019989 [Elasticomyces elasticus]|nr:hypothetical protein LTR56_019989 [Elasticomyces elasticus]KAK3634098.1 hypothetical protein LTR22_019830 [Elasticomyces elasticus]KAK4911183.1 hypothetical protein LTR49_020255 [Elasticomyces elasticus]KAK5748020.1 hypothetical protein LTS12_021949 [Elasticomyces elasticus]
MATSRAARIPTLIYGTAWKKEKTRELVRQALVTGFRGVDTAAQPKHYREDLVGQGIGDAMKEAGIKRQDLYIQTKYTSVNGQDPSNMPYDATTSISEQVHASVASSLRHLASTAESPEETYIDCLVLHSPLPTQSQTREAWQAMESHVPQQVRSLGISNIYELPALMALYDMASIKPAVVQNRFYSATGYDRDIRAFCRERGMIYQSFWTLTGNPDLLRSPPVRHVAACLGVTAPVALYGLVLGLDRISILDGTTNAGHMKADLDGVEAVQLWLRERDQKQAAVLDGFRSLLH